MCSKIVQLYLTCYASDVNVQVGLTRLETKLQAVEQSNLADL